MSAPAPAALPQLPGLETPKAAPAPFQGLPELEPVARRTHVPEERPYTTAERPEVEWSDGAAISAGTGQAIAEPPQAAPAPAPVAPPAPPTPVLPVVEPLTAPVPRPVVEAAPPLVPPSLAPPEPPALPPVLKPLAPVQVPVLAKAPAASPGPAAVPIATREPVLMNTPAGARIERTQFTVQLGELPPAMSSGVDDNEDIIE
jgi:hypothetical protein